MDVNATAKDSLHASCSDRNLTQNKSRHRNPLLHQLCHDTPVVINCNVSVAKCEVNGACCRFKGVELKPGVTIHDLETIQIDGFFARCAPLTQIERVVLRSEDAPKDAPKDTVISFCSSLNRKLARLNSPCLFFVILQNAHQGSVKG